MECPVNKFPHVTNLKRSDRIEFPESVEGKVTGENYVFCALPFVYYSFCNQFVNGCKLQKVALNCSNSYKNISIVLKCLKAYALLY